jgi:DNA-directed RNA polymerase specialized sigma24 family protein
MPGGSDRSDHGRRGFALTRWSLVVAAADSRHPDHKKALEDLCGAYWYPVYAFVRRRGFGPDSAQDITQGFFAQLLEKQTLKAADQERGRFRSFLLAALKFYLSHERDRTEAQKRGGGRAPIPIDADTAEGRYRLEPADKRTPETLYERRWALSLLDRVLDRLREELEGSAQADRSLRLVGYLTGATSAPGYKQLAGELGMSESAVKVAMHRLRGRFRELLREEVAHTVDDPKMVDEELHYLFAAIEES